jgi:hypothetical protein
LVLMRMLQKAAVDDVIEHCLDLCFIDGANVATAPVLYILLLFVAAPGHVLDASSGA